MQNPILYLLNWTEQKVYLRLHTHALIMIILLMKLNRTELLFETPHTRPNYERCFLLMKLTMKRNSVTFL